MTHLCVTTTLGFKVACTECRLVLYKSYRLYFRVTLATFLHFVWFVIRRTVQFALLLFSCLSITVQGMTEGTGDLYSQVKQMDKHRAEPEKIRIWREEQAEVLKKKGELSCIACITLFHVLLLYLKFSVLLQNIIHWRMLTALHHFEKTMAKW